MAICVAMNFIFNFLAVTFNWPLWLDVTGTAAAALILEPSAGLIVGLINNFYLAIFEFNASSLIYYAVSAAVALIVGINIRQKNKTVLHRIITTILLVITVSAVLSTLSLCGVQEGQHTGVGNILL
jgi:energy-coupling factor transport system substrate-specific component